jgi:release factor glutamine methyltransferase
MTYREAQAEGTSILERARVDSPALDASLLLASAAGIDRTRIIARHSETLDNASLARFRELLERRAEGICTAYILGVKEFWNLEFKVTPSVLVPRPDTETLVETALAWIDGAEASLSRKTLRVADICTGSGCIAIALKTERPWLDISATDISADALAVARDNAERIIGRQKDSMTFIEADLLDGIRGPFDLVVSNPPYVPSAVIQTLSSEVQREPLLALDGGPDGLVVVRRLVAQAFERLAPGGRLLIEAGHDQSIAVARLLADHGFVDISCYRDLAGIDRVTGGSKT